MPAFLQPVRNSIFVLRAGVEAYEFGCPYTASATVVGDLDDPETCEILGFTRRFDDKSEDTLELARAVVASLQGCGFTRWRWDRRRKDGVTHVERKL